jgi:hypothetical protein
MAVATFLYEELCQASSTEATSRSMQGFKAAILLNGLNPPANSPSDVTRGSFLNGNMTGSILDLYSLHLFGAQDPLRDRSLSLMRLFAPAKRTGFDHGQGHLPIRSSAYNELLASKIEDFLDVLATRHG